MLQINFDAYPASNGLIDDTSSLSRVLHEIVPASPKDDPAMRQVYRLPVALDDITGHAYLSRLQKSHGARHCKEHSSLRGISVRCW